MNHRPSPERAHSANQSVPENHHSDQGPHPLPATPPRKTASSRWLRRAPPPAQSESIVDRRSAYE